jgi:hypothetical protein
MLVAYNCFDCLPGTEDSALSPPLEIQKLFIEVTALLKVPYTEVPHIEVRQTGVFLPVARDWSVIRIRAKLLSIMRNSVR